MTTKCKYIDDYLEPIEKGLKPACIEMKQAAVYIRKTLDQENVFIDIEKIEKAIELIEKYFKMKKASGLSMRKQTK